MALKGDAGSTLAQPSKLSVSSSRVPATLVQPRPPSVIYVGTLTTVLALPHYDTTGR